MKQRADSIAARVKAVRMMIESLKHASRQVQLGIREPQHLEHPAQRGLPQAGTVGCLSIKAG